ncbi:unnamed protein product [Heligmosomoides polygyrus]|uniref:Secreted protein n=1 Tax=Heligmosomoides polygyrus TaxID=6339 RepID=A0A183GEH7_HELPZ|nr:unnamed protein product [Heligmosomoides polygyrus]
MVWKWGFRGFGTHLSVALALVLLVFNAYLGARTWADLHRQNEVYLKRQTRNFSRSRPAVQTHRRRASSPVWIERNPCEQEERNAASK